MGFLISSNGSGGLYFARLFSLCTIILLCGSRLLDTSLRLSYKYQEGLLLLFLLLHTVPSTALQESWLASSPGAVNMSSWPVSSIIDGKITPAYYFTSHFLCLSSPPFGKDNTAFVVTSLVSKHMPLWDQLMLYTLKTCVCISDIHSSSVNNSSFPLPVPPPALIALQLASFHV